MEDAPKHVHILQSGACDVAALLALIQVGELVPQLYHTIPILGSEHVVSVFHSAVEVMSQVICLTMGHRPKQAHQDRLDALVPGEERPGLV